MAEERVQRRLAAILAADVVGYSRLMGDDEAGTRRRYNELLNAAVNPAIDEHHGRLVKTMGDGFLVEFGSVVDAVQCATDIQNDVAAKQASESKNKNLLFRIGIHLGDVIVEGDDIHGDGVNIAARLEGIAEENGICVSAMVREGIRNKLDVEISDLGERSLKNIADPVHVYHIEKKRLAGAAKSSYAPDAMFRRPAVAVLPFENLSGDPDQEYFADGLTEDIITALSLWRSFPVIARNSTFAYKRHSSDIRQVGEELGARFVIEGSVRKSANRVRVTAQLINAETGHHVWAERYDREMDDIFELQDEITRLIVATAAPELERSAARESAARSPTSLTAWDILQRGFSFLHEFSEDGNVRAREMFERAIEIDPNYSRAYSGMACAYHRDILFGYSVSRDATLADCFDRSRRAVELDEADFFAHLELAIANEMASQNDKALASYQMAVSLNPSDCSSQVGVGLSLSLLGRPREGISNIETGFRLSPLDPRNPIFFVLWPEHSSQHTYTNWRWNGR